jgi:epimerase transport system membrane fusion protein
LGGNSPRQRPASKYSRHGTTTLDRATNQAYYVALVEADAASLAQAGALKLQAGMPAEVYINGEQRTPLQYLVEPVTQVLRRAGRER